MEEIFQVKRFRDREEGTRGTGRMPLMNDDELKDLLGSEHGEEARSGKKLESECRVKIAGFGGQGVMWGGAGSHLAAVLRSGNEGGDGQRQYCSFQ